MQQEIADLLKHDVFSSVRTRHLFTMSLKFPPPVSVGQTPNGHRVLALVTGGHSTSKVPVLYNVFEVL